MYPYGVWYVCIPYQSYILSHFLFANRLIHWKSKYRYNQGGLFINYTASSFKHRIIHDIIVILTCSQFCVGGRGGRYGYTLFHNEIGHKPGSGYTGHSPLITRLLTVEMRWTNWYLAAEPKQSRRGVGPYRKCTSRPFMGWHMPKRVSDIAHRVVTSEEMRPSYITRTFL